MSNDVLKGVGMTMVEIARTQQFYVDRPVIGRTMLADRFNFEVQFALELPGAPPPDAPSIFSAVPEQLGLRLEPRRELLIALPPCGTVNHRWLPSLGTATQVGRWARCGRERARSIGISFGSIRLASARRMFSTSMVLAAGDHARDESRRAINAGAPIGGRRGGRSFRTCGSCCKLPLRQPARRGNACRLACGLTAGTVRSSPSVAWASIAGASGAPGGRHRRSHAGRVVVQAQDCSQHGATRTSIQSSPSAGVSRPSVRTTVGWLRSR
jgi:hypothetical protein